MDETCRWSAGTGAEDRFLRFPDKLLTGQWGSCTNGGTAVLIILNSPSKVALGHISLRGTPTCARRERLGAGLLLMPPLRLQAIPAQATDRHAARAVSCGQRPPMVQPTPVPGVPGEALRCLRCWPPNMAHVVLLLQPCWLPILWVGLLLGVLLQHDVCAGVLRLHTTMVTIIMVVCSSGQPMTGTQPLLPAVAQFKAADAALAAVGSTKLQSVSCSSGDLGASRSWSQAA